MRHSDFLENVYRLFFSAGKREAQASGTCFSLVRRASSDIHEQADRIKPSNHPQASRQKESRRREGRRLREKREEGFSYGILERTSPTAVTVDMFYITARPLEERCVFLSIPREFRSGNVTTVRIRGFIPLNIAPTAFLQLVQRGNRRLHGICRHRHETPLYNTAAQRRRALTRNRASHSANLSTRRS